MTLPQVDKKVTIVIVVTPFLHKTHHNCVTVPFVSLITFFFVKMRKQSFNFWMPLLFYVFLTAEEQDIQVLEVTTHGLLLAGPTDSDHAHSKDFLAIYPMIFEQ